MTNTAGTYRSFEDRTSVALLEAEGEILNFVLAQEMGLGPRVDKEKRITLVPVTPKLEKRMGVSMNAINRRNEWVHFNPAGDKAHAMFLRKKHNVTATCIPSEEYRHIRVRRESSIQSGDFILTCDKTGERIIMRPLSRYQGKWVPHMANEAVRQISHSRKKVYLHADTRDTAIIRAVLMMYFGSCESTLDKIEFNYNAADVRIKVCDVALARLRHEL
ncbi:MAG: hypothetical protein GY774_35155 [Planctomycetes bacterium]|nr:hypothetical protein [Planctomycetota bacterium]